MQLIIKNPATPRHALIPGLGRKHFQNDYTRTHHFWERYSYLEGWEK